ncbi:MAG: TadE/TadG family type IV pilus assembly protein [Terriglobales bacterium]
MKIQRIARQLASSDGSEIAEVALVLPIVFMLLLGIVWFGRAFNIYSTIQQAAQQGAITAARSTCATCGNAPAANGSVTTCPETGTAGTVAYAVATVMCASSIDPTQIPTNINPPTPLSCVNPTTPATCTTASHITICQQALLNSAATTPPSQCGVIVSFQYPFSFYLPFTSLNLQQITLSAQAQSRMEN